MTRNADPAGPVPPADEDGRLVLTESAASIAKTALSAFGAGCLSLYGLEFWYKALALHIVPPAEDIRGRVIGVVSLLAWPLLFWLVVKLILPASLTIDEDGITMQGAGLMRRLGWEEMREIRLREITVGRGGKAQTQTRVTRANGRMIWMPVYGVAPRALAAYLVQRQLACRPAMPVELVDKGPGLIGGVNATAGRVMAATRLAHLAIVAGLGIFALAVALAAGLAVQGNYLAGFWLGKLGQ